MATDRSAEELSKLLRAAYMRFHRRVRHESYRPSRESLAVLAHFSQAGPLTVMEAARHFERSQSAMSEIISRLEARELLQRIQDERDRRRTLVWLTDKGLEAMRRSFAVYSERTLDEALDQMNEEQKTRLFAGLESLLATDPSTKGWDDDD